jgi:hypothetical protein
MLSVSPAVTDRCTPFRNGGNDRFLFDFVPLRLGGVVTGPDLFAELLLAETLAVPTVGTEIRLHILKPVREARWHSTG